VAVAARDKAQRDKLLITEDPSLMFSIVKVARDQTQPGSLFARSRGRQDERPWERGCFISNQPSNRLCESKIIPNIYSDHSAVVISISFFEHEPPRGPGFWKFNNSLLSDTKDVELLNFLIPEFAKKHQGTEDKGPSYSGK